MPITGITHLDNTKFDNDTDLNDKALTNVGAYSVSPYYLAKMGGTKVQHVSLRTDGLTGSGTAESPYSVGGANDAARIAAFKALTTAFSSNTVFYLFPCESTDPDDEYLTSGMKLAGTEGNLGTNNKWFGAGSGITRIRLAGTVIGTHLGTIFGTLATVRSDGFHLQGVTLDCDASNQALWGGAGGAISAIYMRGSNITLKDVEVIKFGTTNQECFAVYITNNGLTGTFENVLVDNCRVHSPILTGNVNTLDGFVLSSVYPGSVSKNMKLVNSLVDMTGTDAPATSGCYANIVESCVFRGLTNGFYSEPDDAGVMAPFALVTIRNSLFDTCQNGIRAAATPGAVNSKGFRVIGNEFIDCFRAVQTASDDGLGNGGSALYFDKVEIKVNRSYKSDATVSTSAPLLIYGAASVTITNNEFNSSHAQAIGVYATTADVRNNMRENGTLCNYYLNGNVSQQAAASDSPFVWANKNASTQSITTATWTKVTFSTEVYDTNGWFASSTFTPLIPGYYRVTASVTYTDLTAGDLGRIELRKGIIERLYMDMHKAEGGTYDVYQGSAIDYCNGTTDVLEVHTYHNHSVSATIDGTNQFTWIQITKI